MKKDSTKVEDGMDDMDLFEMKMADSQIRPVLVEKLEKLEKQLHLAFQNIEAGSIEYL